MRADSKTNPLKTRECLDHLIEISVFHRMLAFFYFDSLITRARLLFFLPLPQLTFPLPMHPESKVFFSFHFPSGLVYRAFLLFTSFFAPLIRLSARLPKSNTLLQERKRPP